MADEAISYLKGLNAAAPEKPFFLYYVPGGTHAPHHPTPEWIKKISDLHLFDKGWNDLRETIFANQKKLGVIPANTQLTPWPDSLPNGIRSMPMKRNCSSARRISSPRMWPIPTTKSVVSSNRWKTGKAR